MTRQAVMVNTGLLNDDDFGPLSSAARGAWLVIMLLSGLQADEGRFRDRDSITRLLRKEGHPDAAVEVEELDANGWWLDFEDGHVELKGYRKWQRFRGQDGTFGGQRSQGEQSTLQPSPAVLSRVKPSQRTNVTNVTNATHGARVGADLLKEATE